jgi:hypothetical protein
MRTEPDGTQIFYKPQVPDPRVHLDKWVDVEFVIIRKPASPSSDFGLTWMGYNGGCTRNRLAAVHGAGIGRQGDVVSMSADETPFTPQRDSLERRVLQIVCQSRREAKST